jgi:hypothetical protein
MSFAPTALLVMTHNVTGLKYFCKTSIAETISSYKGSGVYWKRHLKKHGRGITVGVLGIYTDKSRCVDAALRFSKDNDIVNSPDWANHIFENGLDGAGIKEAHPMYGKPSPQRGVKRPWVGKCGADNPMFGKPSVMRGKKNLGASLAHKGRKRPEGGGKPARVVIRLEDGKEFLSVADAARECGGTRSGITKCCMGKAKSAHGFHWAYKE